METKNNYVAAKARSIAAASQGVDGDENKSQGPLSNSASANILIHNEEAA